MATDAVAGNEAQARGDADGCGCEGIGKSHTRGREGIEVGGLDCGVACTTERVKTLLVGHEKEDVWSGHGLWNWQSGCVQNPDTLLRVVFMSAPCAGCFWNYASEDLLQCNVTRCEMQTK